MKVSVQRSPPRGWPVQLQTQTAEPESFSARGPRGQGQTQTHKTTPKLGPFEYVVVSDFYRLGGERNQFVYETAGKAWINFTR